MTFADAMAGCARNMLGMVMLGVLPMASQAFAQPPAQAGRSGGLVPTREVPSISGGMTRDELLRRFDLDANGRIDEAEAEAARARMRRDRVDTLQNSGLDPLTGRPRGAATGPAREATSPADDDVLILPGAPDDQPPPRKPAGDAEKKPLAKPAPTVPPGRAAPLTGGVRAGAPAVRQGYGATSPKADLNAGRPREPRPLPNGAATRPGTQPAGRPAAAAPRGSTPRPSLFPQPEGAPRPTAEDFGR